MIDMEQIKHAAIALADAADAYKSAEDRLGKLLASAGAPLVVVPSEPQASRQPKPKRVKPEPQQTHAEEAPPVSRAKAADKVLAALEDGPLWFGDVLTKSGLSKSTTYGALAALQQAKLVIQTAEKQWRIA